jgi:hypothetical protein
MTRSLRKRQRDDVAKSEDATRVGSKRKKRSAPLAPTKPPAASNSGTQKKTLPQTGTPPQSKPQRQPPKRNENNKATFSHISPLTSGETRPSTPQRPLAPAQPPTPPISHETWAKILYDADFGSKVCDRFETSQRERSAKYGDLVVSAFPALTPPEAREVFWLAQKELKWMEFGRRWKEMLGRVMSLTPEDECNDAEGR